MAGNVRQLTGEGGTREKCEEGLLGRPSKGQTPGKGVERWHSLPDGISWASQLQKCHVERRPLVGAVLKACRGDDGEEESQEGRGTSRIHARRMQHVIPGTQMAVSTAVPKAQPDLPHHRELKYLSDLPAQNSH